MIINSGFKTKIFKESLVNPMVVNTAINRGGRYKMRKYVVFSVTVISGIAATKLIRIPLASIVK